MIDNIVFSFLPWPVRLWGPLSAWCAAKRQEKSILKVYFKYTFSILFLTLKVQKKYKKSTKKVQKSIRKVQKKYKKSTKKVYIAKFVQKKYTLSILKVYFFYTFLNLKSTKKVQKKYT